MREDTIAEEANPRPVAQWTLRTERQSAPLERSLRQVQQVVGKIIEKKLEGLHEHVRLKG